MENNQNKVWGIVAIVVVAILIIIGMVYAYNDHDEDTVMMDQNTVQNGDASGAGGASGASSNSNTRTTTTINKNAPVLTLLTPSEGKAGTQVTITGTGFKPTNNVIRFSGFAINTVSSSDLQHISFKVPESLRFCNGSNACDNNPAVIEPGYYPISVSNANGTSNVISFHVTESAAITR